MSKTTKKKDYKVGKVPAGVERSPHWAKVRREFLKQNPTCAVCGDTKNLNVHHKKPFHLHPELELDPNNLITLCETRSYGVYCHLLFGHLGNFKNYNPNVDHDVAIWKDKLLEDHTKEL
jgi:hypothetical protein